MNVKVTNLQGEEGSVILSPAGDASLPADVVCSGFTVIEEATFSVLTEPNNQGTAPTVPTYPAGIFIPGTITAATITTGAAKFYLKRH